VASYVAAGTNLYVRDFLARFRGLTGTQARMQVLEAAGSPRGMKLQELADRERGTFDEDALGRLLAAMHQISQPPAPQKLGVLGREHFLASLPGDDRSFRYAKQLSTDSTGLPYVVEAASRVNEDDLLQGLHVGLNWSMPLTNPLQDSYLPPGGRKDARPRRSAPAPAYRSRTGPAGAHPGHRHATLRVPRPGQGLRRAGPGAGSGRRHGSGLTGDPAMSWDEALDRLTKEED
jgi:hypothetical protein